jgi:hypothetical protein
VCVCVCVWCVCVCMYMCVVCVYVCGVCVCVLVCVKSHLYVTLSKILAIFCHVVLNAYICIQLCQRRYNTEQIHIGSIMIYL